MHLIANMFSLNLRILCITVAAQLEVIVKPTDSLLI